MNQNESFYLQEVERKRSSFTFEEDVVLIELVKQFSDVSNEIQKWKKITIFFNSKFQESKRKGKHLRYHYDNTLNPSLKRAKFTEKENEDFLFLFTLHGKQFRKIARVMNRTENSVKNHFHNHIELKRKALPKLDNEDKIFCDILLNIQNEPIFNKFP
jgi:hypothetical protein